MSRFLCICLSPAIDATVRLNAWPTDGCIIKNAADTFAPGGKTVNVARWLALRTRSRTRLSPSALALPASQDISVACGGILGEDNAVMFEKELGKYGIEDRFVRVPGATRVNEMFVTPQGSLLRVAIATCVRKTRSRSVGQRCEIISHILCRL